MSSQYDAIAKQYHEVAIDREDRKYLFVPTVERILGSVMGMKVTDCGCGTGFWTEWLATKGAQHVMGLDESEEMLRIAREETSIPGLPLQAVEYHWADLSAPDFMAIDSDLVFAAFLLNYAATFDALCMMLSSIKRMLPPGGRFVSLTTNPDHPEFDGRDYNVKFEAPEGVFEGCRIRVTDYHASHPPVSFEHFWFPKQTYLRAFELVGYQAPQWHELVVCQEGLDGFPEHYWDKFLRCSAVCVLEASVAR